MKDGTGNYQKTFGLDNHASMVEALFAIANEIKDLNISINKIGGTIQSPLSPDPNSLLGAVIKIGNEISKP